MSSTVISVRNVGKKYYLGENAGHDTLRDSIAHAARGIKSLFNGKAKKEETKASSDKNYFWALKDVSFDIEAGEVVGVIGRNGAGKSTLLKILSQITEPTTGEIRVKGRLASLLEVGTGFHQELSGRENIFLNGAILGMSKAEIRRQFDEIVAFAEVDKFLDTPVKRYSSGMYVRLAFAVAAHLNPDILVVDEVLAVGDASFQSKCMAKMGDVAKKGGRTVIFVSHSMQAVQSLCRSAILVDHGQIKQMGETHKVVAEYLTGIGDAKSEVHWPLEKAPGPEEIKLTGVRILTEEAGCLGVYSSKDEILVEMEFYATKPIQGLTVGFDLYTIEGEMIMRSYHNDQHEQNWPQLKIGRNVWRCAIPAGLLNYGTYVISVRIARHMVCWLINMDGVAQFDVIMDHGVSPYWNSFRSKKFKPGVIAPIFKWHDAEKVPSALHAPNNAIVDPVPNKP